MENLNNLLKVLLENNLEFVLIGGYAAVVHGSTQVTQDIDICAVLTDESLNLLRLALKDLNPRHRMNPSFQPTLAEYPKPGQIIENCYLKTDAGILDIISEVTAVGTFEKVKKNAVTIQLFGRPCKVISLDDLIAAKKSMNRDKDKAVLKDLLFVQKRKKP